MAEIVMTAENRPYLDALIRLVALGRDADAEDKIVEAIQELMQLRAENAAMRPIVQAVARHGMDAFGGRAGGPWVWKCPECGQQIGGVVMRPDGNAIAGAHATTCPVPIAVDMVMAWASKSEEK